MLLLCFPDAGWGARRFGVHLAEFQSCFGAVFPFYFSLPLGVECWCHYVSEVCNLKGFHGGPQWRDHIKTLVSWTTLGLLRIWNWVYFLYEEAMRLWRPEGRVLQLEYEVSPVGSRAWILGSHMMTLFVEVRKPFEHGDLLIDGDD